MAQHQQPVTISRPAVARYIAIAVLILTPILATISFSLTLTAIYSPNFAISHPFVTVSVDSDGQAITAINPNLTYKRAPFYSCGPDLGTYDNATIKQNCTRLHGIGGKGMAECYVNNPDDDQLCQKVVGSASLYVAGAVFIGLAFALAFVVAGLDWKHASAATWQTGYSLVRKEDGGEEAESTPAGQSNLPSLATTLVQNFFVLFLILGGICLILAQVLGVQALVNEQRPTAAETPASMTRWFMGKGSYVYTSVAYLSAFLAAFTAALDCGLGGR
jgi:hypothetical protein